MIRYEAQRCEFQYIAGISSQGDGTIIRNNYIDDAEGAGVRVGGSRVDGRRYGVNNQVPLKTPVHSSYIRNRQQQACYWGLAVWNFLTTARSAQWHNDSPLLSSYPRAFIERRDLKGSHFYSSLLFVGLSRVSRSKRQTAAYAAIRVWVQQEPCATCCLHLITFTRLPPPLPQLILYINHEKMPRMRTGILTGVREHIGELQGLRSQNHGRAPGTNMWQRHRAARRTRRQRCEMVYKASCVAFVVKALAKKRIVCGQVSDRNWSDKRLIGCTEQRIKSTDTIDPIERFLFPRG